MQAWGRGARRGAEGREIAADVRARPSAGAAPAETAPVPGSSLVCPPPLRFGKVFPAGGSFSLWKARSRALGCVCGAVRAGSRGEGSV